MDILKNLLSLSMDLSVYHYLILATCLWAVIDFSYFKLVRTLLLKTGLKETDTKTLCYCIGLFTFSTLSVILMNQALGYSLVDSWAQRLQVQFAQCKIRESVRTPWIGTVYVLNVSFYFFNLIKIIKWKGMKSMEFVQKQLLVAIMLITHWCKCSVYGMAVLFLIHQFSIIDNLSKIVCLISRRGEGSVHLRNLSKAILVLASFFWLVIFVYTIPSFLLGNKQIDSRMLNAEVRMLIALDIMSWSYVAVAFVSSPITRMILSYLISTDRPQSLEYYLFGCEPFLRQFSNSPIAYDDTRRRANALVQTVRLSIVMKRKLKAVRERLAQQAEEDELSEQTVQDETPRLSAIKKTTPRVKRRGAVKGSLESKKKKDKKSPKSSSPAKESPQKQLDLNTPSTSM